MELKCLELTVILTVIGTLCSAQYFGKDLGRLSEYDHGVKGHVFAVDGRTIFIKDFHYDGEGPAAYFYVGTSKAPSNNGAIKLRDERGSNDVLKRYRGKDVTLTLPEGMTLHSIKWFSVWCDEYSVNFGDVKIPRGFDYPKPLKIGALSGVHGVSSDPIVLVDAQTLLIPNFSYDGEAPDAKFWVGRGEKPSPQGIRIPDENGRMTPLRKYDRKTIVLTLPGELTIFDIGHFGVWCEAFTVDFGHAKLPQLPNVPPSLKMLGVSPQSKLNCEVLYDDLAFEVRWAVAGDSIVLQLVAKLEDGEYMSFGLSGNPERTQMVGGDATVAWVDKDTLKGYAHDYFLDAKSQCAGVRGSCPDEILGEKTNSVRLLNAAMVNGYSIVTYQRPLKAADELDRSVITNGSQPIIWAIGPLNSKNEVSYHSHFTKGDKFLEFGRPPVWNCPMPETEDPQDEPATQKNTVQHAQYQQELIKEHEVEKSNKAVINPNPVPTPKPVTPVKPWYIPAITCDEPEDGVFYAQMGPTGGKQGYSAITGHVGWGISWYINGLLIPEITLVRGKKYTFVIEGGSNPEVPAKYHPFYITDDSVGGYEHKTPQEKAATKIYAGVRRTRSGELVPTGVGRSCHWTPDNDGPEADEYSSFGAYQRTLTLICEDGNPGIVNFTPDHNTPDTVYYQCFTHRYLGWKINIVDSCDINVPQPSENIERISSPDNADPIPQDDLLQGEESIQVQSRVKADHYPYASGYNEIENDNKEIKHPYNDDTLTGEMIYNPQAVKTINEVQLQEIPLSQKQVTQVFETVKDLESTLKEESDTRPVYQHSTPPTSELDNGSKDSVPETPVQENEEVQIGSSGPSTMMLPPSQKPLTLQSVMRPNKPGHSPNPNFRRPAPPEIKHRKPITPKPAYGMRNPYSPVPNNNIPYRRFPLSGSNQRLSAQTMYSGPNNYQGPNNHQGINMHQGPHTHQGTKTHQGSNMLQIPPVHQGQNYHQVPNLQQGTSIHQPPNQRQHVAQKFNNQPVRQSSLPPPISSKSNHNIIGQPPKNSNNNNPVIVMAKPANVQSVQINSPSMISSHVVKSKITLPGSNDHNTQQSVAHPYLSVPGHLPLGQIIMGKPVESPIPLDQQMIQTKVQVVRVPVSPTTEQSFTSPEEVREVFYREPNQDSSLKSSDFIGESLATETPPPMPTAINTGFKPETIVIESGFKPIIREPLMASEDRIADLNDNRREDTNMDDNDEYQDDIPAINYVPNKKITESFEPIFIPSPLDRHESTTNRATTQEVFPKEIYNSHPYPNVVYPSNHAKEDRPHPIYKNEHVDMNRNKTKSNQKKFAAAENHLKAYYIAPSTTPKSTTVLSTFKKTRMTEKPKKTRTSTTTESTTKFETTTVEKTTAKVTTTVKRNDEETQDSSGSDSSDFVPFKDHLSVTTDEETTKPTKIEEDYPMGEVNVEGDGYNIINTLLKELNLYDDEEETQKPEGNGHQYEINSQESNNARKKRDVESKSVQYEPNSSENDSYYFKSSLTLILFTVVITSIL